MRLQGRTGSVGVIEVGCLVEVVFKNDNKSCKGMVVGDGFDGVSWMVVFLTDMDSGTLSNHVACL